MDMNEAVAKALAAERSIANLTVRDLSERAGVPITSLMRILGAQRDIKVNQVADLAAALGVYPHEIVEHAEQILARSKRDLRSIAELKAQDVDLAASRHDLSRELPNQDEPA